MPAGLFAFRGRGVVEMGKQPHNPRSANGNARRKLRARLKAMGLDCHLCGLPI